MNCTECGGKTYVRETKLVKYTGNRWRRRGCKECGHRFTTYEHVARRTREGDKSFVVQLNVMHIQRSVFGGMPAAGIKVSEKCFYCNAPFESAKGVDLVYTDRGALMFHRKCLDAWEVE